MIRILINNLNGGILLNRVAKSQYIASCGWYIYLIITVLLLFLAVSFDFHPPIPCSYLLVSMCVVRLLSLFDRLMAIELVG